MKTLMLAGVGALSIGIGSAMAAGSGVTGPDYWAAQEQAAARQAAANPNAGATTNRNATVQYGSSDIEQPIQRDGVYGAAGGF